MANRMTVAIEEITAEVERNWRREALISIGDWIIPGFGIYRNSN